MNDWPFHEDERAAQERAGGPASAGAGIRAVMPEQHRDFFAGLSYLFIAANDADGWPIATILTGTPGFITSPDPTLLRIDALPRSDDPIAKRFAAGQEVGALGLDFATRRRNRANGHIADVQSGGFTLHVRQSFGNCPQYIQRRSLERVPDRPGPVEPLAALDAAARQLIECADTFFVASRSRSETERAGGNDISHRGGRPGFIRLENDGLLIPDFSGNRYFNTLGNLLGDCRAALLFIDFASGDLLQLQGSVEIDWSDAIGREIAGAERAWRFRVRRGWRRRGAVPLRWSLIDYSPATLRTGSWLTSACTSE